MVKKKAKKMMHGYPAAAGKKTSGGKVSRTGGQPTANKVNKNVIANKKPKKSNPFAMMGY